MALLYNHHKFLPVLCITFIFKIHTVCCSYGMQRISPYFYSRNQRDRRSAANFFAHMLTITMVLSVITLLLVTLIIFAKRLGWFKYLNNFCFPNFSNKSQPKFISAVYKGSSSSLAQEPHVNIRRTASLETTYKKQPRYAPVPTSDPYAPPMNNILPYLQPDTPPRTAVNSSFQSDEGYTSIDMTPHLRPGTPPGSPLKVPVDISRYLQPDTPPRANLNDSAYSSPSSRYSPNTKVSGETDSSSSSSGSAPRSLINYVNSLYRKAESIKKKTDSPGKPSFKTPADRLMYAAFHPSSSGSSLSSSAALQGTHSSHGSAFSFFEDYVPPDELQERIVADQLRQIKALDAAEKIPLPKKEYSTLDNYLASLQEESTKHVGQFFPRTSSMASSSAGSPSSNANQSSGRSSGLWSSAGSSLNRSSPMVKRNRTMSGGYRTSPLAGDDRSRRHSGGYRTSPLAGDDRFRRHSGGYRTSPLARDDRSRRHSGGYRISSLALDNRTNPQMRGGRSSRHSSGSGSNNPNTIVDIEQYLQPDIPPTRAAQFGSFNRGQQQPDSDDI